MEGLPLSLSMRGRGGSGGPDANTVFLCRFNTATPTDEVTANTGTLVNGAVCDNVNSRLTLDGVDDYCTFPHSAGWNAMGTAAQDFCLELHADCAAADLGGLISKAAAGAGRFVAYCPGDATTDFYIEALAGIGAPGGLVLDGGGALNGSEHHLAWVRQSNVYRFYFDGIQIATNSNGLGDPGTNSSIVHIGTDAFSVAARVMGGHIGRVKLSNVNRYPNGTTFTPPLRTAA